MKRLIFLLTALMLVSTFSFAKKKGEQNVLEYAIEGAGTGTQGTYLVNVTLIVDKASEATDDMLARAAVHGVLFRGFANKEGKQSQKPIAGSPAAEASHADFFSSFFQPNGAARNYVEIVNSSRRSKKVDKKHHVTATVTVNKEMLRKDLQDAGVIRGLNSIF